MDKAFEIQKQVRENAKTLNSYITDLQNWETEMKRKETALNGGYEQDLPPVRSKVRKEKPVLVKKPPEKRISSSDYKAWENFDVDKACEDIDMEDKGPSSLDSKKSTEAKMEKLREEAQYEKERGNNFVKQEKWDDAIKCYNRAIELVKDDAIYYANRGLCYLKKDSLHQAESDCNKALKIDPTYVKALQRRATAREKLGSLRSATADLNEVIKLEPHNKAARTQLDAIKARMGTKGSKSKSSPLSTPTMESKPIVSQSEAKAKIVEIPEEPKQASPPKAEDNWRLGVGENVTILRPVKKPPHLRSKRPLKPVPIHEIQLGQSRERSEKPPTRLLIQEVDQDTNKVTAVNDTKDNGIHDNEASPESAKLVEESLSSEKEARLSRLAPPATSVQFMAAWSELAGDERAQVVYLRQIEPSKIPQIFSHALDSATVSSLLRVLALRARSFPRVASYVRALAAVKRFPALAMFLTAQDKQMVEKLLEHCRTVENCNEDEITQLRDKYEL